MQKTPRPATPYTNRTGTGQAARTAGSQSRSPVPQSSQHRTGQSGKTEPRPNNSGNQMVACRKCRSQQIVANKRGYSFSKMFKTFATMFLLPLVLIVIGIFGSYLLFANVKLGSSTGSGTAGGGMDGFIAIVAIICWISMSLSVPVSILVGFVGRNEIVNGCMNCGFKWRAGKPK